MNNTWEMLKKWLQLDFNYKGALKWQRPKNRKEGKVKKLGSFLLTLEVVSSEYRRRRWERSFKVAVDHLIPRDWNVGLINPARDHAL